MTPIDLDLTHAPADVLDALRTIVTDSRRWAPVVLDGVARAIETGQLDLADATVADIYDGLLALAVLASTLTAHVQRESDDAVVIGQAAMVEALLQARRAILDNCDHEELRAFRLQSSPPPNAA